MHNPPVGAASDSTSRIRLSILTAVFLLPACTALETTSGPNAQFDAKPHVGQYYLLPKAMLTIEGAPDASGNYLVNASASLVADHRYKYFLNWKSNGFSEDTISNLEVGSDGLLTSVNYSAEDKTPAIVSDVINTGINVFKIAANFATFRGAKQTVKRQPFRYIFDPFDRHETSKVVNRLWEDQKIALYLNPDPARVAHLARAPDPDGGGVFYHPPTTIELLLIDQNNLVISDNSAGRTGHRADKTNSATAAAPPSADGNTKPADADKKPAGKGGEGGDDGGNDGDSGGKPKTGAPATRCRIVMTVPDLDRVVCFRLGRSFMTKREASLSFSHGMPGKLVFKQPSTIQAVTGTINSATSAVASAVPTLIKVSDERRIAALQEQSALITEQSKLLEAKKKLIEDQQELAKLQGGSSPASPSGNRSNESDLEDIRQAMRAQTKTITNLKQDIKRKLEASDLSPEEIQKVIKAAELDKTDEP